MMDLSLLFTPQGLLRDSDGDGMADGVRATLIVGEGASALAAAIELAARLGLESTGLSLPLAGMAPVEGRTPVWIEQDGSPEFGMVVLTPMGMRISGGSGPALLAVARYLAAQHPEPGLPAGAKALRVGLDGRRAALVKGGWQWFGEGEIGGSIEAGSGPSAQAMALDAANSAGRAAGMASPAASLTSHAADLTSPAANPVSHGAIPAGPADLARLFRLDGGLVFPVPDDLPQELRLGLVDLAARLGVEATSLSFPLTAVAGEELPAGLPVRLQDGPVTIRLTEEALSVTGAAALTLLAQTPNLEALHHCKEPVAPPAEEELSHWTWLDEGEVARFWTLWRGEVSPGLEPGRPVQVDLRIQEPRSIRVAMREELLAQLPAGSTVRVATPFKQGYHWIEEELVDRLNSLGKIERVHLQFRRFEPMAEPALELPIRWLQECYPCDLLLERELGLPLDSFSTEMVESGPTYRLMAFGPEGALLLDESYEAVTGCRQYLDAFPERGWVHPPVGSLMVDGRSWSLQTDLGRFWDWFQATVLPTLRRSITEQHGAEPALSAQPLFGRLEVAMTASEEERVLGLREESVSPLEAMHEDLYFVTLDEFATWGRQLHGAPFDAPGTILPFLEAKPGAAPEARVRLTRLIEPAPARPIEPIRVIELGTQGQIRWGAEEPTYEWQLSGYATTAAALQTPALQTPAELRLVQTEPDPVPFDQLIGPENLEGHLAHLARLPGVQVWQAGDSYGGRPIWAVAYRKPTGEAIQPPAKAAAFRPTLLVNARHHANEVSSTNAILATIEAAANGDPEFQGVNLVAIPYENADGAATHWAMAQQNPAWKHHAARFNAVGLEFYGEYMKPETPYTEARALADLFERWLPDVLLDDHGVPQREWIQPFAGWNSAPYFRVSYWLPNALLYGIFRDFEQAAFPHQVAANEGIIKRLEERSASDPVVSAWNRDWLQTYTRWGYEWDPVRFPLELSNGMINYRWPVRPHAFSYRFPEICVCDWVTEVPDETATGAHLERTAWAHMLGHRAAIDFLAAHPQPIERRAVIEGGRIVRRVGRPRPFRVDLD